MDIEQIKFSLKVIRGLNFAYKATNQIAYKIQAQRLTWLLKGEIRRYKHDINTIVKEAA